MCSRGFSQADSCPQVPRPVCAVECTQARASSKPGLTGRTGGKMFKEREALGRQKGKRTFQIKGITNTKSWA